MILFILVRGRNYWSDSRLPFLFISEWKWSLVAERTFIRHLGVRKNVVHLAKRRNVMKQVSQNSATVIVLYIFCIIPVFSLELLRKVPFRTTDWKLLIVTTSNNKIWKHCDPTGICVGHIVCLGWYLTKFTLFVARARSENVTNIYITPSVLLNTHNTFPGTSATLSQFITAFKYLTETYMVDMRIYCWLALKCCRLPHEYH